MSISILKVTISILLICIRVTKYVMGKGDVIESMYGKHYRECINHNATRRLYVRTTKKDSDYNLKQEFTPCGVICTCCGYTLVDKEWYKESAAKHRHRNWRALDHEEWYLRQRASRGEESTSQSDQQSPNDEKNDIE